MDNLAAHKGEKVRRIVEARVCERLYLPPYSPNLNPIEEAFSKIKHFLRWVGALPRSAGRGYRRGSRYGRYKKCGGLFRSLRLPWPGQ